MYLLISSIAMAVGSLIVYIYYAKQGQFDDLEDVKYEMFRNEEEKKCQNKEIR
jgi:cbb3-type cytochrome oxidase maturation protein